MTNPIDDGLVVSAWFDRETEVITLLCDDEPPPVGETVVPLVEIDNARAMIERERQPFLDIMNRYLPSDGISAEQVVRELIAALDPGVKNG